jgi:hypothetical protein
MRQWRIRSMVGWVAVGLATQAVAADGWQLLPFNESEWLRDGAPTYRIEAGVLIFEGEGRGRLMSRQTYSDFELQVEFRCSAGANNGIALRAPLGFQASRYGMEIQILDDSAYQPLDLRTACGAIYGLCPVRASAVRPAGEWNLIHIRCEGRRVQVHLNGVPVVDADLNSIRVRELLRERPGFLRELGHLGFIQHDGCVEFRNLRVRTLHVPRLANQPPAGFTALFNGRDLSGWQSWYADPPTIAHMSEEARQQAQARANEQYLKHWRVENGDLIFDGQGVHLITEARYGDFELWLDWQIEPGGDSGVYLRDTPQVQIWDDPSGSGGLHNNEKHPSRPLVKADNPPRQWNRFRILLLGERVTVWLNETLVAHEIPLENYWNRRAPLPREGRLWLQAHGTPVRFRNIFIRPL